MVIGAGSEVLCKQADSQSPVGKRGDLKAARERQI